MATVVHKMSQLAELVRRGRRDPIIRDEAWRRIASVRERDELSEARALFSYVQSNIRYVRDPYGEDVFEEARFTLGRQGGDCDATSVLLGAMLQSCGFPYRLKVYSVDGNNYSHIAGQVGLPKSGPREWITVDASADRPMGWENPAFRYSQVLDVV